MTINPHKSEIASVAGQYKLTTYQIAVRPEDCAAPKTFLREEIISVSDQDELQKILMRIGQENRDSHRKAVAADFDYYNETILTRFIN